MKVYPSYLRVCSSAVKSERAFRVFRRSTPFHNVVEGIPGTMGILYINYIKEHYPYLLEKMPTFAASDAIGSPTRYYYEDIDVCLSSVTGRYIKILGDLTKHFGSLKDMDIVEIGVGFGGQCKIIHDYVKPKSYTIIDLPEVLALSQKYLTRFGVKDVQYRIALDRFDGRYSLCISNYAFSEFDRMYQDFYVDNIISKSEKGYMICNFFGENSIPERSHCFSKEEILKLKPTGQELPEEPCSTVGNFLYIW